MRNLSFSALALAVMLSVSAAHGAVNPGAGLESILKKYVKAGVPDYSALKKDGRKDLDGYLQGIASFNLEGLKTENEKISFWINVYNAFVLKIVADNYPVNDEIFKVKGFFDLKRIKVAGNETTLSNISNAELLMGKETKDPRINFALFNGTVDSPKLMPKPFDAKTLDEELERCTREFIQNTKNVFLDTENKVPDPQKLKGTDPADHDKLKRDFTQLRLSSVFKWFEEDFKNHSGSVLDFIAAYLPQKDADYLRKNKDRIVIDYAYYDWTFLGFNK